MKIAGLLNLFADITHNFTDGMAIAASFLSSPQLGVGTAVAVLFHEVPHEVGDYAILVSNGLSHMHAVKAQLLTATGAFLGCTFGLFASS